MNSCSTHKSKKLQSDITNLLELIRRIREENSWDATGLTFHEVTREDIFGTEDTFSGHIVGSVCDSQLSAAVSISVETSHSSHQNQNKTTDVVIHQHSRKLMKMDILMSETC